MGKSITFVILMMAVAVCWSGCSGDDGNEQAEVPADKPFAEGRDNPFLGKWELIREEDGPDTIYYASGEVVVEYFANGEFYSTGWYADGIDQDAMGKYTFNQDYLESYCPPYNEWIRNSYVFDSDSTELRLVYVSSDVKFVKSPPDGIFRKITD